MKRIVFYKTEAGRCPVQEYLDTLTDKQVTKISWVLKLVRETDPVPATYLKKLVNTDDIWEIKVNAGRDTFRLLGFFKGREWVILTNSFQKKTQKTPSKEIKLAERRKKDFLNRS
ncbi:MAG: type II toxin-antitoxin system RelE/ParE family toxin [Kiritimatiellia bacterium]